MPRVLLWALSALVFLAPVRAQESEETVVIEMRVSGSVPGASIAVDRGTADGLALGDVVTFTTRAGASHRGTVIHVADRTAMVELSETGVTLEAGTRGESVVPASRLAVPEPAPAPEEPLVEHPPWQNADEDWSEGQPLLAEVGKVDPKDRSQKVTGRAYVLATLTETSDAGRSDSFYAAGSAFDVQNPFGKGGSLNVDAMLWSRDVNLPDARDENTTRLRFDRASYTWGGDRFNETRWEVGRFLQFDMPEFGVLDGAQWSKRLENGHRYGISLGFMPEPNEEFSTLDDLQIAAYYRWSANESERFTVANGFQKTWNNGDADRTLMVTKVRYLPARGWDFNSTTWVDFYSDSDAVKGRGSELTQARLSTSRRWESGDGLEVTYSLVRFPELLRNEFTLEPLNLIPLLEARASRLGARGWTYLNENRRLHGRLGVWDDEEDSGFDGEIGMDMGGRVLGNGRVDLSGFYTAGQFSYVAGGRLSLSRAVESGTWDVFYELADHHQIGFLDDFDDIIQHRFGVGGIVNSADGWNLSARVWSVLFDSEASISASLFLQKSF